MYLHSSGTDHLWEETSEIDSSCLQGGSMVMKMALSSIQPDYTLDRLLAYPRLLTYFFFLYFRNLVLVNSFSVPSRCKSF